MLHCIIHCNVRTISLSSARFRTSEGLFQPRLLGKDNPGIHELVQKAVQACAVDTRKELYRYEYRSLITLVQIV